MSRRRTTAWPVYAVWHNMLQRCTNPRRKGFEDYGGRGIRVCDRWRSFDNFLADMGEPPAGMTIERKDTDGHYEPSNCEWVTRDQQARNKRNNVVVIVDGEPMCMVDALKRTGMRMSTFYYRVNKGGMTPQQAFDIPVRAHGSTN